MGMDVTPDKQNINTVFSNTTYYIDFYQRQYKWSNEPVYRLLDDVFYKFSIEYEKHSTSDIPLHQLIEEYGWYYLNTYVTNPVGGKLYIVDGQQRLTTITLILIKLMHLGNHHNSPLVDWISQKIVGFNGYEKEFWMKHEQHLSTLKALYEGQDLTGIDTSSGVTAVIMVSNYSAISQFLDESLQNKHKYESFVFYFLKRLVLINLNVEQTDVPMVFEVINDRGVKLKPYEILKGKLLGQVDKKELDHFQLNELWDTSIWEINREFKDEVDEFFMYLLRAKFANTIGDSRKYDKNNYHRTIFEKEVNAKWKLDHNPKAVKDFLLNDFKYFTALYNKVLNYYSNEHEPYIHVYYNRLTEMDSQYLLTLSVCKLNDSKEDEKIQKISYEVDRFYSLLQLQKGYDSNDYNEAIYKISQSIREQDDFTYIRKVFDEQLISMLSENRGLDIKKAISYQLFKDTGYELNKRFKRYFFARIEKFISKETNMQMRHSLYDLVSNTGSVNGFHIEHILSVNADNLAKFNNDNDRFERERNRLGGLLLLKGKDNISSSNEKYSDKLKTYANTLYWNETLRQDTYKTKIDFKKMINNLHLDFEPLDDFGPDELEKRHKLLYKIIKIIWK
ncbi:uncharacterized protein DUF262/uncharacterized protein DUF1524 [Cytobacillus horneckiae]|uniref:DUF262 domain-containing protein n=1 Tax=Cytobacillus horneckiae TaxID=549687 RepID=UPI0019D02C40|nr:DUF262 domain-containing protein [Cytobacillus horneckiae]MBN6889596.1 DUF262 domain-containing protein [Cytobacillus horneckiae]MCM3180932.1 DUF262 domain-containing protein [Cytobacillus horneckiae]